MNVTQQTVKNRPIKSLEGLGIIALIILGMMAASALSNIFVKATGNGLSTLVVWLAAIAAAAYLMRERIVEFRYTVSQDTVYLERRLGEYTKILDTFPVMDIVSYGPEQTVQSAHPEIKNAMNLTLKNCSLEKVAILYKKKETLQIAILQPDTAMMTALWDEELRRQNKANKWGTAD